MRHSNSTSQSWRKSIRISSLAVVGGVGVAALATLGAGSAQAATPTTAEVASISSGALTTEIPAGRTLTSGQTITSAQGKFKLSMEPEGDLAIIGAADRVLWTSGTGNNPGAGAVMRTDGNLEVIDVDGNVLWSTKTSERDSKATIDDAGNLVIATPTATVWSSETAPRAAQLAPGESLAPGQQLLAGDYSLTEQEDGNVVIAGPDAAVSWTSGTDDAPGATLTLQPDGAVDVSGANDTVTWETGAHEGAEQLTLTDSGNLAVIGSDGSVLWDLDSARAQGSIPKPVRTTISREKILERAHYWLETQPQYSQVSTSPDENGREYRSDCSGYISMAWAYEGQGIGVTTHTLSSIAKKVGWDDVQPGDALLRNGHVVLVASWEGDGGQIWHMSSPSTDMVDTHRTLSSLKAQGYTPYRYDNVR